MPGGTCRSDGVGITQMVCERILDEIRNEQVGCMIIRKMLMSRDHSGFTPIMWM